MTKLGGWKSICALLVLCTVTAISSQAQTYVTLHSFNSADGNDPLGALVQGRDGNFYGSTRSGGAFNLGTIFKISPGGTLTTLHSFCAQTSCPDGSEVGAPLALGTDGNFYGTTSSGGANSYGTVFKITGAGALTTLYSFCAQVNCTDGIGPIGGLVQGVDGNFYGTTYAGGVGAFGTVFKITGAGSLTTLYSFCPDGFTCTDGVAPFAGLVQGTDGNFYGTTTDGGTHSQGGTVFEITPKGILTTLYSFCALASCTDGLNPFKAVLIQGADGNFYGTTSSGGANSSTGTIFKITSGGTLTKLYDFCAQTNCTDGINPYMGVIQGTDGNLYGTTSSGGSNSFNGYGTVFEITRTGTLTTLYSFCPLGFSCTDATSPYAGLVQGTSGLLYGTASSGGAHDNGTVFSLAAGLGAFVEIRPASGKEGAKIGILGQGFSSSSLVKFGGTKATTIVLSGTTFITATVPAGALTGAVTVTTGTTTLTSAQTFRVLPTITSFTPTSGTVGTAVMITGTGLMQTTTVTFGGVKATTVIKNSDTQVTADVPTGAKTGKIGITTKGGKVTSTTSFTVN